MPETEAPTPNKIKIDLVPYWPICTPLGYRCVCKEPESDWDDYREEPHQPIPQARIGRSWFLPEETKKMPCSSVLSNPPPQKKKVQSPPSEENTESDWDVDSDQVLDFASRPHAD